MTGLAGSLLVGTALVLISFVIGPYLGLGVGIATGTGSVFGLNTVLPLFVMGGMFGGILGGIAGAD